MLELMKRFSLMGSEWVLWLLVVLSVISVAIMIERSIRMILARTDADALMKRLLPKLSKGEFEAALKELEPIGNKPVVQVLREGLKNAGHGTAVAREVMSAQIELERQNLMKYLSFLGTVGANAPFIGLFGTVLGIIKAFHDLAQASQQGPSVVMAGISEALVATAIGLLVAIPAVVAFNYFRTLANGILSDCERTMQILLAFIETANQTNTHETEKN